MRGREGFHLNNDIENQSITFDVNETLFLKSGQGISEMQSIALDPDIVVQSYGDYVQVRGLIVLQGEYVVALPGTGDKPNVHGTMEHVQELENNEAEFTHRFPVDITVASHRVNNVDEITVMVDAFDYELSDRNTLKIKASIIINGIDATEASVQSNQDTVQEVEEVAEEEVIAEEVIAEPTEAVAEVEEQDVVAAVVEEAEEVKEVEASVEVESEFEATDTQEPDIQLSGTKDEAEESAIHDVQYLTDIFGEEKEETYTKMRLYITQPEDTIATIAKQYHISALQLLKDNNLSQENLSEGQLIKIPISVEE